ncbi:MAG TPA: hypothetical protein VGS12_11220 [Caulobacteraceae bacterium]|nr:hypothetical protein [Caulobacteraceae bacterium]
MTATDAAIFIRLDGVSIADVGGLAAVPALCGALSPSCAQNLANTINEALKVRLALSADKTKRN